MLESVRRAFDNPVYCMLYSRDFVRRQMKDWLVLSLIFLALLLILYQVYNRAYFSIISLGFLIFICLSVIYLGICIFCGFRTSGDPLTGSVRQQVADQVVITGISPRTWLEGHLLSCIVQWLFLTAFLLPCMCLCWLLGGVPFGLPPAVLLIGLACMITFRLCSLLTFRAFMPGLISTVFFAGAIAVSVPLLILVVEEKHPPQGLQLMSAVSISSPLPLVAKLGAAASDDVINKIFQVQLEELGSTGFVSALFFAAHIFFWMYASIGIIAGFPRSRFDLPKEPLPEKSVPLNPLADPNAVATQRNLGFRELKLFFQQNTFSKNHPRFEFAFASLSFLVLCLFIIVSAWLAVESKSSDLSYLLLGFAAVIVMSSFSICFSKTAVLRGKNAFHILFPSYFGWAFLMGSILLCTAFLHADLSKYFIPHPLIPVIMIMLASFIFSIFSSVNSDSYSAACAKNLYCYIFLGIANLVTSAASVLIISAWKKFKDMQRQGDEIAKELSKAEFDATPVIFAAIVITSAAVAVLCLVQIYIKFKAKK